MRGFEKTYKIIKDSLGAEFLSEEVDFTAEGDGDQEVESAENTETTENVEQQVQPLSSGAEATLVSLIKKAFAIKPNEEDVTALEKIGDVNPNNAKQVLDTVQRYIQKYDDNISLEDL